MTPEQVTQALDALVREGEGVLKAARGDHSTGKWVDLPSAKKWGFAAAACLESVFGPAHHLTAEAKKLSTQNAQGQNWEALLGVIQGARAAWVGGYVFDARRLARADVESDLIGQATQLLAGGYERAAAVVAGAVLEAHLRDVAPSWSVATTDAKGKHLTLTPLSIELKKAGTFDGIMQSRIEYLAKLRNDAAHGGPFDGRAADVERMIRDVIDTCDRVKTR